MFRSLFAFICLIGGPFLAWHGLSLLRVDSELTCWPTVPGVVSSSSIFAFSGLEGRTTYKLAVNYTYKVAGILYYGDRVDSNDEGSSMATAQAALRQYSTGSTVTVHHHPSSAATAFLEVGTTRNHWLILFGGLALFGWGVWESIPHRPKPKTKRR